MASLGAFIWFGEMQPAILNNAPTPGSRLRIGICGFGVAGGSLAILLSRQGHDVTILERAPELGPVGAGFLLQPAGQRILHVLGVEAILQQSARIERLEAFTASGRRLTDLRYGRVAEGACAYGVHRGLLFDALHAEARRSRSRIVLAAEITEIDESPSDVSATDGCGRHHGPFDLLIGADGARSALRQWLNPSARRKAYEHGALWATGRSAEPADRLVQMTRGAKRLVGLLPVGDGRCTFFWGLPQKAVRPLKERGFAAFCEEVLTLFPMAAEVLADIGSFDRMTFAGYQYTLPRRLYSRRVVIVGDAGHAMSPHLGQGANLALLDAECLARKLSEQPLAKALSAYAVERRSQSRYFATMSKWLSPFFQSDSDFLGWSRDLGLPLMCAVPWLRRQMELSVAGMKKGFFDRLWR